MERCLALKAEPHHLIGLPAVSGGHPYSMTATACKGAELCEITLEYFRTVIGRDPALSFRVLQILATEVHSARRLLGTMLSSAANSNLPLEDSE